MGPQFNLYLAVEQSKEWGPPQYHTFVWEGRDDRGQGASSGVYFAQVKVEDKTLNHRLILIK